MVTSRRKAIGIAIVGFLLTFTIGLGIAVLNARNGLAIGTTLEARLNENSRDQPFIVEVSDFQTEESLDFIQFSNPNVGWAGNKEGVVYRTTDRAKSWESLDFKIEGYVSGMHFTSESSGWAISMRYPPSLLKTEF